ncbi:MAG: hypothetical protein AB7I50_26550, partial [Vicinamibacterales bacterium]
MPCPWCGDTHRTDQLCQRAQHGMTRRSFCFLFGAGVAGAVLLREPAPSFKVTDMTPMGWSDARVVAHKIYTGDGQG